jgi:excisionase family DNA binding protein
MASHSLEPRSILEHGPLISPRDAANLLGVHVNSIRQWIAQGRLPAYRLAGNHHLRVSRDDLAALIVVVPVTK